MADRSAAELSLPQRFAASDTPKETLQIATGYAAEVGETHAQTWVMFTVSTLYLCVAWRAWHAWHACAAQRLTHCICRLLVRGCSHPPSYRPARSVHTRPAATCRFVILGVLIKQMYNLRAEDRASVEFKAFKFLGVWTLVIWSAYPVLFVRGALQRWPCVSGQQQWLTACGRHPSHLISLNPRPCRCWCTRAPSTATSRASHWWCVAAQRCAVQRGHACHSMHAPVHHCARRPVAPALSPSRRLQVLDFFAKGV